MQCGEVSGECVSTKHSGVKKKKKKKKKEEVEVVASDPTSTTSIPDHMRYTIVHKLIGPMNSIAASFLHW